MKILLCLYRTLGDCILGSTLIEEIKKKHPDAEITWAIHKEYVELADTNPNVKGLIITDDHDIVLSEMASGRYDKVMVPAQTSHTDSCWHQRDKYKDGHLVDFYAKRCGLEVTERETKMYFSEADWDAVIEYVATTESGNSKLKNWTQKQLRGRTDDEALKDGPVIVIHTMSRVPSKDWHLFGEFVEALKEKYEDTRILQVGGPDDTWSGADIDLRGKLTYNQIAALLSMTDLFVGVDSGLAYIADSVKCKSIVIMGMSSPVTSGPISGRATFIEPKRPEGCEWPCHSNCRHGKPCIQSITVEEVMDRVEDKIG